MNGSIPTVLVVAALAAVAIGFGNALMDLATVAGGAALAWWGFWRYQSRVGELKEENRSLKQALQQADERNRDLQAKLPKSGADTLLLTDELETPTATEPAVLRPRGFFRKR